MTSRHQSLRAPKENGRALIVPETSRLDTLLQRNRQAGLADQVSVMGTSIGDLRVEARSQLASWASHFTRQYLSGGELPDVESESNGIVMAGHQPELFHAGVWFKNFLLSELASRTGSLAVNLLIDNDLCGLTKLPVLGGTLQHPKVVRLPFDQGGKNIPYENRRVHDSEIFEWFGGRVKQAIAPFTAEPIISELWPSVVEGERATGLIGQAFARGRHALEHQQGLRTLEIPLSRVVSTASFAKITSEILLRIDEFQSAYNQSVQQYRFLNGIKSNARPVPDLDQVDEYFETPLWIWSNTHPIRRAMYVRLSGDSVEISDLKRIRLRFEPHQLTDALRVVGGDYAIRPKALLTTMYSRMILSDLFIHGIGGAKYDELTDQIACRFFGVQLPQHVTATATMKLNTDSSMGATMDIGQVKSRLRELRFHAEHHIDQPNETQRKLIGKKRQLLAELPPNGRRKKWHQEISRINLGLQAAVEDKRAMLAAELDSIGRSQHRNQLLSGREYSFCLFDQDLAPKLKSLCAF